MSARPLVGSLPFSAQCFSGSACLTMRRRLSRFAALGGTPGGCDFPARIACGSVFNITQMSRRW